MQSEILLNTLSKGVTDIQDTIKIHFEKLSFEQLNWKENSETWSIAECLEHLNIYANYYLQAIEKQIKKASKNQQNASMEATSTWFGRYSINSIAPSNTKKIKTMKHLNPSNSKIEGHVLKRFLKHQEKLQLLLKDAKTVNINKLKIPVEFFKLLKINLGDCFQFLIAHEQRHLNQALNVKRKVVENQKLRV